MYQAIGAEQHTSRGHIVLSGFFLSSCRYMSGKKYFPSVFLPFHYSTIVNWGFCFLFSGQIFATELKESFESG